VAGVSFHHEAVFYDGERTYMDRLLPFLREGIGADEPMLVAVSPARIRLLSDALGADAERIVFVPMDELGRNPARIIPAWRAFADAAGTRSVRGIGEPIWAGRSQAELDECYLHESLLNVAFAERRAFQLLCPYDTSTLSEEVLHRARASHPCVGHHGTTEPSEHYCGAVPALACLPAIPGDARRLTFDGPGLGNVRRAVAEAARELGVPERRVDACVLAVNEIAANSVRHGGGVGELHVWSQGDALVCEIRDGGCIADPLAGRHRPTFTQLGGRGLWMVNQLCDLVQIRTPPHAPVNTVRVWARI
jgi:anti-sigma regulatory factor (Ser/Thr protein kinase)